jgi:hypothetical protein
MKCRNCDNQLQPGWIACPACGERFVEPVPQAGQVVTNLPVVPKKSPNILGCGCLAVIVIIIIGYAVGSQSSSSSSEPDATPPASQASTANSDTTPPPADSSDAPTADAQSDNTPPLQVQSWSWSSDDNFITVNGTVTNVSDQPMSNVVRRLKRKLGCHQRRAHKLQSNPTRSNIALSIDRNLQS